MRPVGVSKTSPAESICVSPGIKGRSSTPAMNASSAPAGPAAAAASATASASAGKGKRDIAPLSTSALAARTIESGAARLQDAADAAGPRKRAVATRTAGAGPVVNRPAVLEITELAGRLHIVAQGRAAGGSPLRDNVQATGEHPADRRDQ